MAENDGQERTEDASQRRLEQAREKGQVARSREFNSFAIMLSAIVGLYLSGEYMAQGCANIFVEALTPTKMEIIDARHLKQQLYLLSIAAIKTVLPFLLFLLLVSVLAPMALGGSNFSMQAFYPKLDRLDPIAGLKKMISIRALVETVKSILKVLFLFGTLYFVVNVCIENICRLDDMAVEVAIPKAISILMLAFFMMTMPVAAIAAIDIPYQIWQYNQQTKMTKQEVKDEHKDTEGSPEVRQKLRQKQNEVRQQRMMSKVPEADVVITNPTHFAVAIQYDESYMMAPIVVAKGKDIICDMIKKVADANQVPIVEAPPLARSLYYHVELEQEVPSALYVSVAKILAYVFELKLYKTGQGAAPNKPTNLEIPEAYMR